MGYKIPIMDIQDILVNVHAHPKLVKLTKALDRAVASHGSGWGIMDEGYKVNYELENQWYPVFEIENRWLADYLLVQLKRM